MFLEQSINLQTSNCTLFRVCAQLLGFARVCGLFARVLRVKLFINFALAGSIREKARKTSAKDSQRRPGEDPRNPHSAGFVCI